jgi:small nuclear ribonucleoprotein (snRNP)-like protein
MQSYQHQVRRRQLAPRESKEKEKYVPPLYKYLDKTVFIQIKNGGGNVSGTSEGLDAFQNLILANAVNESQVGVKEEMIGRVVRFVPESLQARFILIQWYREVCLHFIRPIDDIQFIRGNMVHSVELVK